MMVFYTRMVTRLRSMAYEQGAGLVDYAFVLILVATIALLALSSSSIRGAGRF